MNKPAVSFGAVETVEPITAALIEAGILDSAGARRAQQAASGSRDSVVAAIHQFALADDARVVAILSERFGLLQVASTDVPHEAVALAGISTSFLRRHRVLPLGWIEDRLLVGVIDPLQSDGLAAIAFAAGCAAEPRLMSLSEQKSAFDALYGVHEAAPVEDTSTIGAWSEDTDRMRDQSDAGPAVRIVDALLERAIEDGASDIHIEPLPDRVRVRFRIDGALKTIREEPPHLAASLAARIKVLADMDIADRRSAQDGRTSMAAKGRPVDVRISTVPSAYGEAVALRLLRRESSLLDLETLGFSARLGDIFNHIMSLRRGLFLITGPTGSGKTTTLYAMIERLRTQALKILSIEDPIEYFFPDITQVQVNEDAGVTFPTALRSFLRQDPDIILVGEIRDPETARIAVQAALTGHLVLATLHTFDAAGAIARLADMGADRYLVAATLAGAVSQRLARRLCPQCSVRRPPSSAESKLLFDHLPSASQIECVADAAGCAACKNTGFAGRIAIAEGFLVDEPLRESIQDASTANLNAALKLQGFTSLPAAAALAAASGRIIPAELRALLLS